MIASATRSASARSTRSKVVSRSTPSMRSMGRDPTFKWMSDARCSTACRRSWSRSSIGPSPVVALPTYRHRAAAPEAKARPSPAVQNHEAARYPGRMAVRTRWTGGRALPGGARAAPERVAWALVRPRDADCAAAHLQLLDPAAVTAAGVRALGVALAEQGVHHVVTSAMSDAEA